MNNMTNATTGIKFNIFDNAITKYGDTVSHTPTTQTTSNIEGDETLTEGSAVNINVYIVRKTAEWFLDKPGYLEGGDAIMLLDRSNTTVKKNDKITWKGNNYRILAILDRDEAGGNLAFKTCQLFKI